MQAKSGTGKTLVFSVLILEAHNPDVLFSQSLTIVPTREIAVQIEKVLNKLAYSMANFRAQSFIGGLDITQGRKNLQNCSALYPLRNGRDRAWNRRRKCQSGH